MSSPVAQEETTTEEVPWWSRKKVWLIAGIVLALILVIVLVVVLCVIFLGDEKDEELVTQIKSMMMPHLLPCEQFYEYACGGWYNPQNISSSLTRLSRLSLMKENYDKKMLGLLEKQPENGDPMYKKQPRQFFASCMDTKKIEQQFPEFLNLAESLMMSIPLLDSSWREAKFDPQYVISKLTFYGVSTLFRLTFVDDGMSSIIYVANPITYVERPGYTDWVILTLQLLGIKTGDNQDIQDMFKLDEEIASLKKQFTVSSDMISNVEHIANTANWFDWKKFFEDIAHDKMLKNENIDSIKIKIENLDLLATLSNIVVPRNYRALANCMFMSLLRYTSALDSRFKLFPIPDDVIVSNRREFSERNQKCLYQTTELFPELVTKMFADEYLPAESITFMKEMSRTLIETYATVIKESNWLWQNGKSPSIKRVQELKETVGVPEYFTPDEIDKYNKVPTEKYFETVYSLVSMQFYNGLKYYSNTNAEKWLWKKYWTKNPYSLIKRTDTSDVFIDGQIIFLPNEFLLSPVFEPRWRSSMKYGALGSIIGHQITHAFVQNEDWFGAVSADMPAVEAIKSCLEKQYSSFTYRRNKVEYAKSARKENACDNQGISVSFKAYRNFVKNKGSEESKLSGLDLTQDQLFFLNYAQMMCEHIPSVEIKEAFSYNIFPFHVRVNGTLQNSKEFADAFGCSSVAAMNPQTKCAVL